MKGSLESLQKRLNYNFTDLTLLTNALTHRSAGRFNNERLEYLGDAILGFIVASELYDRFPKAKEGELSRLRASLVNGQALAVIGRSFQLGEYLNLGPGELKSGGGRRESILAGALEAIIGAVYLDGGIERCQPLVLALMDGRFSEITPETLEKDPKTRLQEYLQARRQPLPVYETLSVGGAEHNQNFKVSCSVKGMPEPTVGLGHSRRAAEQQAAEQTLKLLFVANDTQ